MKKGLKLITTFLAVLALASCNNNSGGGSPSGGEETEQEKIDRENILDTGGVDETAPNLSMPKSVTAYEKDTTNYDSLEEEATSLIRIFYRRKDNLDDYSNYYGWRIWAWDAGGGSGAWYNFTKYNEYGVICDIPVSSIAGNGTSISNLGIVITNCDHDDWTGSYSKDPQSDVLGEVNAINPGGIQQMYVISGDATFYYSLGSVFMSTLKYARVINTSKLRLTFATTKKDFHIYRDRLTIKLNDELFTGYHLEDFKKTQSGSSYQVSVAAIFNNPIDLSDVVDVSYRVASNSIWNVKGILTTIYDSEEFIRDYSYTGNDLGVTFDNEDNPTKTTFKLWSPVCKSVTLNVYEIGEYMVYDAPETYPMTKGEKGVWSVTVNQDLSNKYYTYTVVNSAGTSEVTDPYAKSAGINGKRGMIVNFKKLNQEIEGWASDTRPVFGNQVDASIYEIHVRDMTINPNSGVKEANRGKFLGLAEEGTTYSKNGQTVTTGLDHLAELGITHVQIQPFYDYSSVDERTMDTTMGKDNYNWGYDPENYNVLEGSYSTNPVDGSVRIKEFKQMVMALHNKGINIIMDVVYNHTSSFTNSNFEKIVPNYYHRTKNSGEPYNGSGCGNEVASERFMVNKFIRESTKFWTEEYHLAGYRFDLMGLMDNQVMIDVYNDNVALYDKILVFGEPWTGGSSKLSGGTDPNKLTSQQTVQSSLNQSYFAGSGVYVGAFSDGFRNAARGDNAPGTGYVTGVATNAESLLPGIKGLFNKNDTKVDPQQVINYVSCHDNYTLYDQIKVSTNSFNEKAYQQAETLVFTSQGVPFMQEGEDFCRSKYDAEKKEYIHNSYNVGDLVNNMDYELKLENSSMFEYFKDLIAFRKSCSLLTLSSREQINNAFKSISANNGVITYEISDGTQTIYVIHTVNQANVNLDGNWNVAFANDASFEKGATLSGQVMLKGNTSIVLTK